MGQLVYLKDVVTLRLNQEKCVACGMCLEVCPRAVLSLTNGTVAIVNRDACIECGACSRNCPVNALSVKSGVGCATAVINAALGRKKSSCCCTIDSEGTGCGLPESSSSDQRSSCC